MTWGGKRKNKYNAKKTVVNGITFHSDGEARHVCELWIREKAGEIKDLELQPKFKCVVNGKLVCSYSADAQYFDVSLGETLIIDVKSKATCKNREYRIKKKLVEALHGIEITEVIVG